MWRNLPRLGPDGGPHHQELIDLVRFEAPRYIPHRLGIEYFVVADRNLMIRLFRQRGVKGSRIADVVFVGPYGLLPVEIGRLQADKWHGICPCIHISFSHKVSVINAAGNPFEQTVRRGIEQALASLRIDIDLSFFGPE